MVLIVSMKIFVFDLIFIFLIICDSRWRFYWSNGPLSIQYASTWYKLLVHLFFPSLFSLVFGSFFLFQTIAPQIRKSPILLETIGKRYFVSIHQAAQYATGRVAVGMLSAPDSKYQKVMSDINLKAGLNDV